MTIDIDHDTIAIAVADKGGGDVGTSITGSKAGVDVAAADAGMPSSDDRGTDGWKIVEKGKRRGSGRPSRSTSVPKKILDFDFNHISETTKKRRAETTLNEADKRPDMADQLAQMKELMLKMLQQQQDLMQKQDEDRKRQDEDRKEIQQLRQQLQELLQDNTVRKPRYSEVLNGPRDRLEASRNTNDQIRLSPPPSKASSLLDDKRMVIINTLRAPKGEKQDYTKMKAAFEEAIKETQQTSGCKIRSLGPLAGERLGVVFETEENAERARKHPTWHQAAVPGARI